MFFLLIYSPSKETVNKYFIFSISIETLYLKIFYRCEGYDVEKIKNIIKMIKYFIDRIGIYYFNNCRELTENQAIRYNNEKVLYAKDKYIQGCICNIYNLYPNDVTLKNIMMKIDFRHFDDVKYHHYLLGQEFEDFISYVIKLKYNYEVLININNIMKYVCSIAKRVFYVNE